MLSAYALSLGLRSCIETNLLILIKIKQNRSSKAIVLILEISFEVNDGLALEIPFKRYPSDLMDEKRETVKPILEKLKN
jgi:hypothetical protein